VFPVRYELGFYNPKDDILHSHRCVDLKSYIPIFSSVSCSDYPVNRTALHSADYNDAQNYQPKRWGHST
jgi:hypothetical protein